MKINYHGRKFVGVTNSPNGQVSGDTIFQYQQRGYVLTGTYAGGSIRQGNILGKVNDDNSLHFVYQHLDDQDLLKSGYCNSRPEFMADGRIRLHEFWEWTVGGEGKGISVVEEIKD